MWWDVLRWETCRDKKSLTSPEKQVKQAAKECWVDSYELIKYESGKKAAASLRNIVLFVFKIGTAF